jgi:hypothetical protein
MPHSPFNVFHARLAADHAGKAVGLTPYLGSFELKILKAEKAHLVRETLPAKHSGAKKYKPKM